MAGSLAVDDDCDANVLPQRPPRPLARLNRCCGAPEKF
jgi:hypothetical protein